MRIHGEMRTQSDIPRGRKFAYQERSTEEVTLKACCHNAMTCATIWAHRKPKSMAAVQKQIPQYLQESTIRTDKSMPNTFKLHADRF
jgi:hypothetical protein